MPPRQQVNTNLGTVQRTPAARPVDAFEQVGSNPALEMAKALEGFRPALQQYTAMANAQWRDEQIDEATVQAEMLQEVNTYKEAVQKGLLEGTETPIFRKTFQQAKGRVYGRTYNVQLNKAYEEWIANPPDEADPLEWLAEQRQSFLGDFAEGDDYMIGLSEVMTPAEDRIVSRFQQDMPTILKQRRLDSYHDEVNLAAQELSKGLIDEDEFYQLAYVLPSLDRDMGILSGTDLNEAMVDAVVAAAITHKNLELLNVLDKKRPDGTKGPGRTKYGSTAVLNAQNRIASKISQEFAMHQQLEARQRTVEERDAMANATSILSADPDADVSELLTQYHHRSDVIESINRLQTAFRSIDQVQNEDVVAGIWEDIFTPGATPDPMDIADRAMAAGGTRQLASMLSAADQQRTGRGLSKYPQVSQFITSVSSALRGGPYAQVSPQVGINALNVSVELNRHAFELIAESEGQISRSDLLLQTQRYFDALVKVNPSMMDNKTDDKPLNLRRPQSPPSEEGEGAGFTPIPTSGDR